MERLGRYSLSYILSYLNEYDGTSFLLCKKRYTYQLLPLFRIIQQRHDDDNDNNLNVISDNNNDNKSETSTSSCNNNNRKIIIHKNHHKFVISPVQDAIILLERFNTKQLYRQYKRHMKNQTRVETQDETQDEKQKRRNIVRMMIIPLNCNTKQIAEIQWNRSVQMHNSLSIQQEEETGDNKSITKTSSLLLLPLPNEQLLRFYTNSLSSQQQTQPFHNIRTILASYPRCGNTLLRTLLERITCYVTGSDTRPDRILSKELSIIHNLIGEGITSSTPIIKTHWPERIGCQIINNMNAAIILIRNPYDTFDSYFNMNCTCSHTKTVTNDVYQQYYNSVYKPLIHNEIHIYLKFYHYYYNEYYIKKNANILFVRYEDLLMNPIQELIRIMKFLLVSNDNDEKELSTFWYDRIQYVVSNIPNWEQYGSSYQPRSTTTSSVSTTASSSSSSSSSKTIDNTHQSLQQQQEQQQQQQQQEQDDNDTKNNNDNSYNHDNKSSTTTTTTTTNNNIYCKSIYRYTDELIEYIQQTSENEKVNYNNVNYLQLFGYNNINTIQLPFYYKNNNINNHNDDDNNGDRIHKDIDDDNNNYDKTTTPTTTNNMKSPFIDINVGQPYARSIDDPYGRLMYQWRHSVTENDTKPLPTISKQTNNNNMK